MTHYWESAAERSEGVYAVEELEAAAYRLVTEQVIYHADKRSRTAYGMIERFERDFRDAIIPLGLDLYINRPLRYVCARPRYQKAGTATVQQTLFALVLRYIYEEEARQGRASDEGEVLIEVGDLSEQYTLLVNGRDFPNKAELDALLRTMKRWGIARRHAEEDAIGDDAADGVAYVIAIRPAIMDLIGEGALQRLVDWSTPSVAAVTPSQESVGQPETSEVRS
jgi:hypothetical protein